MNTILTIIVIIAIIGIVVVAAELAFFFVAVQSIQNVNVQYRQTLTNVSCTPTSVHVNQSISCTIFVIDNSRNPVPITGSVVLAANYDSPGNKSTSMLETCTVNPAFSSSTCNVTFSPNRAGQWLIVAHYDGDGTHRPSDSITQPVTVQA